MTNSAWMGERARLGGGRGIPPWVPGLKKVAWPLRCHGGSALRGERCRETGKSPDHTALVTRRTPARRVVDNEMSAILTRRKRDPHPSYKAEPTKAEDVSGCCINPFIPQWLCLHSNPEVLTQAKLPVDVVLKALIRKYAQ